MQDAFVAVLAADNAAVRWISALRAPFLWDEHAWEGVLEALEDRMEASEEPELRRAAFEVAFYCLRDLERAQQLGGDTADPSDWTDLAKAGNWRKVHEALKGLYAEHGRKEADHLATLRGAEIALGLGKIEKAVTSLRKLSRSATLSPATTALLKGLYRLEGKWTLLIDMLKKRIKNAESSEEHLRDLRTMAHVYRTYLQNDVMEVQTYNAVLRLVPEDSEALLKLTEKHVKLKRYPELVDVLRRRAALADTVEEQTELLLRVSGIYKDKVSNQGEAVRSYEAVLAVDDENDEAIRFLAAVYKQRKDWKKFVAIRHSELGRMEDSEEKLDGLREIAEVSFTRLRNPGLAEELWRTVLSLAPADPMALAELSTVYERQKNWTALADVLEQRLDLVEESEKALILERLGALYGERLANRERSVDFFEALIEIDSGHKRAAEALKKGYMELRLWDRLESFFASTDNWPEYVRLVEHLAGGQKDVIEAVGLFNRAARVWIDVLEEPRRGVRALERIMSLEPTNRDAALKLAEFYEAEGNHRKLREVLTVLLSSEQEQEMRFSLQLRLARLCASLRDSTGAFEYYCGALRTGPMQTEIHDEVEAIAAQVHGFAELEQTYRLALDTLVYDEETEEQGAAVQAVRLRLGRVLDEELNELEQSLKCYTDVLSQDSANMQAIEASISVYDRLGDNESLLAMYRQKLDLLEDVDDRVTILAKIAAIRETGLDDPAGAIEDLNAILEAIEVEHGEYRTTLSHLHRLYEHLGDWEKLVETINLELAATPEDDATSNLVLHRELGRVLLHHLGNIGDALEAYSVVLAAEPADETGRQDVSSLLEDDSHALGACAILEPILLAEESWDALVRVLEIRLEHTRAIKKTLKDRKALLDRIVVLHAEKRNSLESAFEASTRLLTLDPADVEVRDRLESFSLQTDAWAELADVYVERLADLTSGKQLRGKKKALATHYAHRVAQISETYLDDVERSIDFYRTTLEFQPKLREAVDALAHLHNRAEQWPELLEAFQSQIALSKDDAEIRTISFQVAALHENQLTDPEQAVATYQGILGKDESDRDALSALERLHEALGQFEDLAENLQTQAALCEEGSEEWCAFECRLAETREEQLGQVENAVETYESVLQHRMDHPNALAALERLIEDPAVAGRVARILGPIYDSFGEQAKLVATLLVELEYTEALDERLALYHRISNLQERSLADPSAAFRSLLAAAAESPLHDQTVEGLYRLAGNQQAWGELVTQFNELALEQSEPEKAAALYEHLASLSEERLNDPKRAAGYWRDALEQVPGHRSAILALERLHRDLAEWEELVEILLQKVELEELAESVDEQKGVLFQAATIFDEFLERPEDAISTVERIAGLDETDQNALDELNRLYRRTKQWSELIDVLNRGLDLAEADEQRSAIWHEMGPVYEKDLEDAVQAIEVYRKIVDAFPEERQALDALLRLYNETENWTALLKALGQKQALAETPEEALDLRSAQGRLLEVELYEIGKAIEVYAEVLAADPRHLSSLQALEGMLENGTELSRVSDVLEPLYRAGGDWSKLIHMLNVLVADETDAALRAAAFVKVADINEHELVDADGAFDAVCTALAEVPSDVELADRSERLAGTQARFPELVALFEQLREDLNDTEGRLVLGKRAARILEVQLVDSDASIRAYNAVIDIEPNDGDALTALDRLYEQSFQWTELSDVIEQRILLAEEGDSIALRQRLGDVLRKHLGHPGRAVETFNQILAIQEGEAGAIGALQEMFAAGTEAEEIAPILAPYYASKEDWPSLVDLKLACLHFQDDPDDRFVTLSDAGEIALGKMEDREQALVIYGQALSERPSDETVLTTLQELAQQTGNHQALALVLKNALGNDPDERDAQRISLRLAHTLNDHLNDLEGATKWFKYALDLEPSSLEALAALDGIYLAGEWWVDLADILRQEREQSMSDDDIVGFSFRLAELYEHRLGNIEEAIASYRDVVDVRPSHRDALSALEAIFQRQMDWEELYNVYEQRSTVVEADEERAEVYQHMANLAMNMLDRPEDAIDLWLRVLDNRDGDANALSSLEVLYETTERFTDLVDVLEKRIKLAEDIGEQRALLEKVGRVQRELGDDQRAIAAFNQLLELSPGHNDALQALRELYEDRGESELLAGVLTQLIDGESMGESGLLEAHRRLGELYGDVLGKPEEAIEHWRWVVQLNPADDAALDQLERHYIDQSLWPEAVDTLERKVQTATDPVDRLDLLYRISELWQTQVKDSTKAAAAYERILEQEPSSDQAYLALEEIYRSEASWDRLIEIYLGRLQHLPDRVDRLEVLGHAAAVFEDEKKEPASAFFVVARMFKEDPLDPEIAARLERLSEAAEVWDSLIELYTDTIGEVVAAQGVEETLELHQRVARYYRERTSRPMMAEIHYHKVLDIDSADESALKGLEDIYQQGQSWQELVSILKRRLDLPIDVDEQIHLLLKIGLIEQTQIGNSEEAVIAFNMVLSLDGENRDSLNALEEIYTNQEEWRELIEVLNQRANVTYEPEEAVEVRYRVGQLWETKLSIPDRAIDVYRDILATKPEHEASLDRLEFLYIQVEKWDRYIDILEMRLALDPPQELRVNTLMEMAGVYLREFDEVERAVEAYNEVLGLQPGRMDVITALHNAYVRSEYWEDLARMLSEQVQHVTTDAEKTALLILEARAAADQMDDLFRAIGCFQQVLTLDENHPAALNGLADLYEKVGQWEDCITTYDRLILISPEVSVQTVLLCRVGRIFENNVLDDEKASERYQTALDLDPGCEEAMRSLRLLYLKTENWEAAVEMLRREVDYSRDLGEKSALLAEAGFVFEEHIKDMDTAVSYYQQAMDLEPYNLQAAAPLAEYYLDDQQWARALPLLQALIEKNPYGDQPEALQNLHYSLGLALEELDQEEQALYHYRAAHDLDPTHLGTLEALSRIYARRKDSERAYELLDDILRNHGDELTGDVSAQYLVQQADIKWTDGDRRTAQELFEKALGHEPNHVHALRRMIEVLGDQEDWGRIVDYQIRLAEVSDDKVERFTLLLEAGDTFRQSLGQNEAAIEAYRAALKVDENSMAVLHRLLEIFSKVEDWQRAAEILVKMAQLETDPEKHARRCRTIGFLLMDNLNEPERAIEFFTRALDTHMTLDFLDAFEAVEAILTAQKDWAALAGQYKQMIKRVTDYPGNDDLQSLKVMLWHNLGEIYRSRLEKYDNAIEAYKAAAQLDPTNSNTHAILAQLFERVGGRERDAIGEYHSLIQANPFHFDTYHLLFARYLKLQDYDAAWCVSGALVLFNQSNEQEKAYYERYLGPSPPVANKTLANEHWDFLSHDKLSRGLSRIMAAFTTSLRHEISYDLGKTWKVHKKKDLLDLRGDLAFAKRYNYTINVLGVPPANVYIMRDQVGGIRNANSDPPALVVGHDMLQGRSERELAFEIGKALCLMKPEHYLGSAYPATNNLKIFFLAAMRVARPEAAIAVDSADLDRLVGEIEKNPHLKVGLKNVTDHYIQQNENPNFSVWLKALEYSSDRVGLLLSGDIGQAVSSIKNSQLFSLSKATTKERLQEVVLFSMSREYLNLRRELSLAIAN